MSNSDYSSSIIADFFRHEETETLLFHDYKSYLEFCFTVSPVIHVPNQLVGAPLGTDVGLECFVEASPKSINYWVKDNGKISPLLFTLLAVLNISMLLYCDNRNNVCT